MSDEEHSAVRARLVAGSYSIVLRCLRRVAEPHSVAELVQEGVLALCRAIDLFLMEHKKGFVRFVELRVTRRLRRLARAWARERRLLVVGTEGLSDPSFDDPFATLEQSEAQQKLEALLEGLPELQQRVIRLRFGVGVREPTSTETISKNLCLPHQRVRYLEERALCTLRLRVLRTKASFPNDETGTYLRPTTRSKETICRTSKPFSPPYEQA
jgi:RNA polymerase sigma factor (sigma-70 family)